MRTKRKIMTLLIVGVLVLGGAINVYAAAKVLSVRDTRSEGIMQCSNMTYTSEPKAQGTTKYVQSDYPIYYRSYIRVVIYDKNGNVNKTGYAYTQPMSLNKEKREVATVTVKATSKSKAYRAYSTHNVDKWNGKIDSTWDYTQRYIASRYLTTYFD